MATHTQGASAPSAILQSPRSVAVALIGAELIRCRVKLTDERRIRLQALADFAVALGAISPAERAATLATVGVAHG